jgi:hexosaminidase
MVHYQEQRFLVKGVPADAFYIKEFAQQKTYLGFDFSSCPLQLDLGSKKGQSALVFEPFQEGSSLQGEPDAYRIHFYPKGIRIQYSSPNAAFYAFGTLLQTLQGSPEGITLSSIEDKPQFTYRGMHLDVCRHYFDLDFLKRYLDLMALYKMNTFHWHLTEDQAWRLEIKAYPRLTEIGAFRDSTQYGPYRDQTFDQVRYGAWYSQDQARELVAYATQRGITVIPEIELPGHSSAALAAYPELGCTQGPYHVQSGWGVFDDVYCAGRESTFEFLETVLDEVLDIFPSANIHIGGDECPKTRWASCQHCQQRILDEGLADEHELQSYFIQRVERYLNSRGRTIIGWDEILEGGLAPNASVMSWRGEAGGIAAAKLGHSVIMTPGKPCYFDHYQSRSENEPLAIGGFNPVDSVYLYNPIPTGLSAKESSFILGAQGNVWTEYMTSSSQVEYMVLPRLPALAEALWTQPEMKNAEAFHRAASTHISLWESRQFHYAKHLFE